MKGNTLFHSSLIYPHILTLRGLGYFSMNAQFHWLNGSTYRVNNFIFLSSTKATGCGPSSSSSFLPASGFNTSLERFLDKHNTDINSIPVNIKISYSLGDWCSWLFHVIRDSCYSKRVTQFLRRVISLVSICVEKPVWQKVFPSKI